MSHNNFSRLMETDLTPQKWKMKLYKIFYDVNILVWWYGAILIICRWYDIRGMTNDSKDEIALQTRRFTAFPLKYAFDLL